MTTQPPTGPPTATNPTRKSNLVSALLLAMSQIDVSSDSNHSTDLGDSATAASSARWATVRDAQRRSPMCTRTNASIASMTRRSSAGCRSRGSTARIEVAAALAADARRSGAGRSSFSS